jgi:hypothetical protein
VNIDLKTSLLTRLRETHTNTRDILNRVDLEAKVSADSDWRIRDILGHIATWDGILAKALSAYLEGSQYVVIQDWDQEEVEFNRRAVQEQSKLPAAELIEQWQQAHKDFAAALAGTPPEKLSGEYVYPWADERGDIVTLVEVMIEHNSDHYQEIARAAGKNNQPLAV